MSTTGRSRSPIRLGTTPGFQNPDEDPNQNPDLTVFYFGDTGTSKTYTSTIRPRADGFTLGTATITINSNGSDFVELQLWGGSCGELNTVLSSGITCMGGAIPFMTMLFSGALQNNRRPNRYRNFAAQPAAANDGNGSAKGIVVQVHTTDLNNTEADALGNRPNSLAADFTISKDSPNGGYMIQTVDFHEVNKNGILNIRSYSEAWYIREGKNYSYCALTKAPSGMTCSAYPNSGPPPSRSTLSHPCAISTTWTAIS